MLYPNWQDVTIAEVYPKGRGAVPTLEHYAHLGDVGLDVMAEIPVFNEKKEQGKYRKLWEAAAIFAGILQKQNPKEKIVLMHKPAEERGCYCFGGACFYIAKVVNKREAAKC